MADVIHHMLPFGGQVAMKISLTLTIATLAIAFNSAPARAAEPTTADPDAAATLSHRFGLGGVIALVREGGLTSGPELFYQLTWRFLAPSIEADGLVLGGGQMATVAVGIGRATNAKVLRFTPWVGAGWMWFHTVDGGLGSDGNESEFSGGGPMLRGKLALENRSFGIDARFDWAFTKWESRHSSSSSPTLVIQNDRPSASMGAGIHWWF